MSKISKIKTNPHIKYLKIKYILIKYRDSPHGSTRYETYRYIAIVRLNLVV